MIDMTYEQPQWQCYAYIWNNEKIYGSGQCPMSGENLVSVEISDEVYTSLSEDDLTYIWDAEKQQVIENPNYEEDKRKREEEEMLQRTLTPSDVERALLHAKGWDFEDLKQHLKDDFGFTDMQIKAVGVELRANDFFRGATLNGQNLFNTLGALLGYTPADMDYLFVYKELPVKEPSAEN